MVSGRRVLVVDGLAETQEVLKAVLEPRGLCVDRVRTASGNCRSQQADRPRVIVIHADEGRPSSTPREEWNEIPQIIIGDKADLQAHRTTAHCCLPQPFEYAELIQAIERLLAVNTEPSQAA